VSPVKETMTAAATPPPSQSEASAPPRDDRYVIKQMVAENIDAGNAGAVTRLMAPYAETVDFLDEGIKSREAIAQDLPAYFAHWPIRHSTLVGEVGIDSISQNERKVTFTIDIEARNPGTGENRANRVEITWMLRRYDSSSDFKIIAHKQRSASQSSEPQLQQMVNTHIIASSRGDIASLISLYADQVDFLNEGLKSRNVIEREMHDYFARWPIQQFRLASDVSVTSLGANERKLSFRISFTASNPVNHKTSDGTADVIWIVRRSDQAGVFKIVSQKQQSIKRSN
jgi:ketosteroid isomerase-like protein